MINYIFYIYFLILVKNFEIPLYIKNNIPYVNINFENVTLNFVLDTSIQKTLIGNESLLYEEIIDSSNYCNDTKSFMTLYGNTRLSLYINNDSFSINDNNTLLDFKFNNFSEEIFPYNFTLGMSYENDFMNYLKEKKIIDNKIICINTTNNSLKFESCSNELKNYKFEIKQENDHIKLNNFIYIDIDNNKITYTNNYALLSTSTYNIEIPQEVYNKYLKDLLNNDTNCISEEDKKKIKIDKIILNIDKYNIEFNKDDLYYKDEENDCYHFLFTCNEYKSSYDNLDRNFYRFGYGFIKKFDEVEINYEQKNIIIYTNQNFKKIKKYSNSLLISFFIFIGLIFFLILLVLYIFISEKCENNIYYIEKNIDEKNNLIDDQENDSKSI